MKRITKTNNGLVVTAMFRHSGELNKQKIKANAEKVKEYFKDYSIHTRVINQKVYLQITNPNAKNRDMEIEFTKDETTFNFSYQHAHFCNNDLKGLIEYIDSFLSNRVAAVEFFEGEMDFCGGSREYSCIDLSTSETISSLFSEIKEDLLLAFKSNQWKVYVRCWDPAYDKSIAILWDGLDYSIVPTLLPTE
jgi:hypothetical protein